jgi:hypothetical protein
MSSAASSPGSGAATGPASPSPTANSAVIIPGGATAAEAGGGGGTLAARAEGRPWLSWATPLLVCVLTALYATLPAVLGSTNFYLRGDSASQFLPTWYHLGQLVRSGYWPPLLDPTSWYGGNYPAEALLGIYNPLNALTWVAVSFIPNLAIGSVLAKAAYLTLLALGVYLLSREYGAARWAASIVAVALPFSGYTLYWDAASWASGLIAFAYVPHVWWSLRKVARGRLSPVWAFLIGALAITQGNPYGVLGVLVVGIALVIEQLLTGNRGGLWRVLLTGVCIAAFIPLVFQPLLATTHLAHRSSLIGLTNSGFMRPNLGDLLALSAPAYLPMVKTFHEPMQVPSLYFSWFFLPLLPWLRWSALRGRARELAGLLAFGVIYLMFTIAPSKFWMFRWPLRLVEYFYLGLAVGLAVLLSAGVASDRIRARTTASLLLVLAGGYLSFAQTPQEAWVNPVALVLAAALTAALLWSLRRLPTAGVVPLVAIAQVGTLVVLGFQILNWPQNQSAGIWGFPHSVTAMRHRFDHRYSGTTIQFDALSGVRKELNHGGHPWQNVLGGSVYHAIGVKSVNTYSGMGFQRFTKKLCLSYSGRACARGYYALWEPTEHGPDLADLMKVTTVVVQRSLVPDISPKPGWRVAGDYGEVVVLKRSKPLAWPHSRLSWVSPGVTVLRAGTKNHTTEAVDLTANGTGAHQLVFARLAWPGYTAKIKGHRARISQTSAGLLQVTLPPGVTSGTLRVTFRPPGYSMDLALAGLGLVGALVLALLPRLGRRPPRRAFTGGLPAEPTSAA